MSTAIRRLVTFGVGDAWYAADIAAVERVLRLEGVHPVPGMPDWVEGVIDYAGRVVPVVDLQRRLARGGTGRAEARGATGRLLVLACDGDLLAARVDRVVDVRAVTSTDVVAAPAMVQGMAGDFVLGVLRRDGAMVFVLDVPRLFSVEERDALRDVGRVVETMGSADPSAA